MTDNRLDLPKATSPAELNIAEARGWVIDAMNEIEKILDSKITDFFEPKDKDQFKMIVLSSSVISFGS